MIHDQCKTENSLVDQLYDMTNYFDEVNEQLTDFMTWQESADDRDVNLPKMDETQKMIIFREWEISIKQVEAIVHEA